MDVSVNLSFEHENPDEPLGVDVKDGSRDSPYKQHCLENGEQSSEYDFGGQEAD